MAKESRTKFVILGLLANGVDSGYAIKKFIEKSVSHFWSESYGQIYPMLKKFTAEGMISEVVDTGKSKRDKKRFVIESSGQKALSQWLETKTDMPTIRDEMLLKLFLCNSDKIGCGELLLKEQVSQFTESLDELLIIESQLLKVEHSSKVFWLASVRFGISSCRQRIEWAQDTMKDLKKAQLQK